MDLYIILCAKLFISTVNSRIDGSGQRGQVNLLVEPAKGRGFFHRHAGKRRPYWLHARRHGTILHALSRQPSRARGRGITKPNGCCGGRPEQEDADAARCVSWTSVFGISSLWAFADATTHGATGMPICRERERGRARFSRTTEPCQIFSFKK